MAVQPRELIVSPEAWEQMKKRSAAAEHARCEEDGSVWWDADAALRATLLVIFPGGVRVDGEEVDDG